MHVLQYGTLKLPALKPTFELLDNTLILFDNTAYAHLSPRLQVQKVRHNYLHGLSTITIIFFCYFKYYGIGRCQYNFDGKMNYLYFVC